MKDYNLGFISNENIYNHVKDTVKLYRNEISLKQFNENIIDPIKLTFDSKIYGKNFEEIIEAECIRQIDKTNTNNIRHFHQKLFKYIGNGWQVPEHGFDIINDEVPQKRERLILIAIRNDIADKVQFHWPEPYHRIMTLRDALYEGILYDTDVPDSEG